MKKNLSFLVLSCLMILSLVLFPAQTDAEVNSCKSFKYNTGVCGKVVFPETNNNTGVVLRCPSRCIGDLTAICISGDFSSVKGTCTPPPLQPSALTEPSLGVPITSSPVVFKWAASPSPGAHYSLIVGTSPGASDLLKLKKTRETYSRPVKVPIDGNSIYFLLTTTDKFGQSAGLGGQYQILVAFPICNNGLCQTGESCESCPQDCGICASLSEGYESEEEPTYGEFITP